MSDGILNRCYEDEIRALRAQDARHRDAVNYWIGESDRLRAALAEKDAAYKWACEDQAELRAALEAAERQRDWWKDHELELAQERNDLGKALAEAQAERDALKERAEAAERARDEFPPGTTNLEIALTDALNESEARADALKEQVEAARRDAGWCRSLVRDAIYALRNQDDLSRTEIADAMQRGLDESPAALARLDQRETE